VRRKIDSLLAIGVVSLVLFGVVMIYSASVIVGITKFHDPQFFFKREIVYALLGLGALAVTTNIDYRFWQRSAKWLLILTFVLLISVFIFSKGEINGAHRWIVFGGFSFQPAELVKFTFIAYLAAWFAERKAKVKSITETFLPFAGVTLAVSVLMLLQPDFGTLTVIITAALTVFLVAGMTWKQFGIGLICIVIGLSVVLSAGYRQDRLKAYFSSDQEKDCSDPTYYHVCNISIAIGSGGWFGLGFGESRQKRLFLPEPHTDSIFAVTVEELGFVVSALLVLAITFLIYRSYRVAVYAPDIFGRLLATGITTWFAYQAFLNLAAMLQLVPLKGVPLPFISYGGTNLIISLFAAGVLLNISRFLRVEDSEAKTVTPASRKRAVNHSYHS
jgi:cell division protein FtsW